MVVIGVQYTPLLTLDVSFVIFRKVVRDVGYPFTRIYAISCTTF